MEGQYVHNIVYRTGMLLSLRLLDNYIDGMH